MPRPFRSPVAVGVIKAVAPADASIDAYAFTKSGDTLYAFGYNSGNYVSQRGTLDASAWPLWLDTYTYAGNGTTGACVILSDSAGLVGDGSLAYVGDDDKLVCWDVVGETSHVRTTASGYHAGAVIYDSGYLYWAEVENAPHTGGRYFYVRSMRGRTDFTSVSTLATYEFDGAANDGVGCDAYRVRRTSTGCWYFVFGYYGETSPSEDVWFADSGSTSAESADANGTDGMRASTNAAIFGGKPYSLAAHPATATDLYPSASAVSWTSGNVVGGTYQVYDTSTESAYLWSVAGDEDATEADEVVTVDEATPLAAIPDLYYLASE